MANLLLGPLLRYVSEHEASVWVETGSPCTVEVRAGEVSGTERTFTVSGHHYAIVGLTGLSPGSSTPYQVLLDGDAVWPPAGSKYPPSRIRTVDREKPVRLLFGSCREPPDPARQGKATPRPDVLDAYAVRMASQAHEEWPDALLMVGDQVYADDTSQAVQEFIRARRDVSVAHRTSRSPTSRSTRGCITSPGANRTIRWLLSTLPSSMIFDDHDVLDDWNTSHAWRQDMQATPWWEERITGALRSYWIYQHLGNLKPERLAADETYRAVRAVPDGPAILRRSPRPPTAKPMGRRARCGRTGATSGTCASSSSTPAAAGSWPTASGR